MELLTKQVSLSLALGQAGQGRAQLSFSTHSCGVGDGLNVALPFCQAEPAPTDVGKQAKAVAGVRGGGPSIGTAPCWRISVRFLELS